MIHGFVRCMYTEATIQTDCTLQVMFFFEILGETSKCVKTAFENCNKRFCLRCHFARHSTTHTHKYTRTALIFDNQFCVFWSSSYQNGGLGKNGNYDTSFAKKLQNYNLNQTAILLFNEIKLLYKYNNIRYE